MASLKDIAKKLNLAVSTISMALNDSPEISEETKLLVAETAKEMNYVKNGNAVDLQRKKTNTILLIIEDASKSYFSNFINGFQKYLSGYSYDLLIATTYHGNIDTAVRFLSQRRADGAVVFTKMVPDEYLIRYAGKKFPVVAINRNLCGDYLTSVISDNERGAFQLTNYLIERGHRDIIFVKGTSRSIGSETRYKGFLRAMEAYHLTENVYSFDAVDSSYECGRKGVKALFSQRLFGDAIFFANDDLAVGGIDGIQEMGYAIPRDISVVGFNDSPISRFITPKLTTVSANQKEGLAKVAVENLMNFLTEDIKTIPISFVNSFIIERESVKRR